MLNADEKRILRNALELLERMCFAAADPHVDCRDEMYGWSDVLTELLDDLDELDDQGEGDKPANLFEAEEKRGGA